MNKTIIINISGAIFHIEEDAYEVLKAYMTEVKRHFGLSADSFEIVTDIENRIAELFSEILKRDAKQVIIMVDVQAVIAQMGRPADFENEDGTEPAYESGSAAGSAAGSNFSGNAGATIQRKLYRDADDKVVGGVCSGLAHYFSTDPVWLRLIWAILFFAGGIGFIPYIILWIVMPVARTRAEKLAMYGEQVNLETIKNSVSDELNDVKKNLARYRDQVRNSGVEERIVLVFKEIFQFVGRIFQAFFKVFGAVIGFMLIFFGGIFMLGLIPVAVMGILNPDHVVWFHLPFSAVPAQDRTAGVIVLTIALLIPLLFLVLLGIRILFKKFILNTPVASALLVIWFLALCFMGYFGIQAGLQFRSQASFTKELPIASTASHSYYLKADNTGMNQDTANSSSFHSKQSNWHIQFDAEEHDGAVNISIEKSDSSGSSLTERIAAKGYDEHQALKTADAIEYRFSQKDTVLNFSKTMFYKESLGYHDQQVDLTLKIPLNTVITIDQDLNINNLPNRDDYKINGPDNVWIMTNSGLKPKFGVLKHDDDENSNDSSDGPADVSKERPEHPGSVEQPEKPEQPERPEQPEKPEQPERHGRR